MSVPIVSPTRRGFHARSNVSAAFSAFWAIVSRDLLVTRREFVVFLVQTLVQPLFYIFVFGKVLSAIGSANAGFSTLLLPGVVALTTFITALQGTAIELGRDLGFTHEIEDRLLAPIPIALVAVEKVMLATLRGLIAGALVFPLAYWILGNDFQVRSDQIAILIGLLVLEALLGATLGLLLGSAVPVQMLPLIFALVFTPLIFTGCTFYSWDSLSAIKWFQTVTLFNPLTYAAEGMRYAMVPLINGQQLPTLALGWILLALGGSIVLCFTAGMLLFRRSVLS